MQNNMAWMTYTPIERLKTIEAVVENAGVTDKHCMST